MEKKELEKKVDMLFKEQCANIVIPNYKLKLKKRHIEILNSNNSIEGYIYIMSSSPKDSVNWGL